MFFLINLAASAAKYCEKEAVNRSAASTASLDYVKFQAVIKSAASAASPDYAKLQAVTKSAARLTEVSAYALARAPFQAPQMGQALVGRSIVPDSHTTTSWLPRCCRPIL